MFLTMEGLPLLNPIETKIGLGFSFIKALKNTIYGFAPPIPGAVLAPTSFSSPCPSLINTVNTLNYWFWCDNYHAGAVTPNLFEYDRSEPT